MGAKFSPYDVVALIPPGTVLIAGIYLIYYGWPDQSVLQSLNGNLGDFGLALLGVLVAGELVHAIARVVERICWYLFSGWPTERLIGSACDIAPERRYWEWLRERIERGSKSEQLLKLSEAQKRALRRGIRRRIKHNHPIQREEIAGITREIYVHIFNAKRTERVDIFNRNYGMYSGLVVTFGMLAILAFAEWLFGSGDLAGSGYVFGIFAISFGAVLFCVCGAWMAGYDYADELVLQFINLSSDKPDESAEKEATDEGGPSLIVIE